MDMGKEYIVHITKYAFDQMENIKRYISFELKNPQAAKALLQSMKEKATSLKNMPSRNPLVNEKEWKKQGIRKVIVKNFLMYYWINEEERSVYITAVVYEKRSQLKQLQNMDLE